MRKSKSLNLLCEFIVKILFETEKVRNSRMTFELQLPQPMPMSEPHTYHSRINIGSTKGANYSQINLNSCVI